ncbi:MAG: hypothetical protein WBB18_00655, partial [Nodosilinea sp.]
MVMNRAVKTKPQARRSHWQSLIAPMLLASLGLHGLFLLIPTGSSEAPLPPPDSEQDSIAITRVPPAGTPDPAATSAAVVPAPAAPAQARQPLSAQPLSRAAPPAQRAVPRRQPAAPRSQPPSQTSQTVQPSPAQPRPALSVPSAGTTSPANPPPPPPASSRPLFSAEVGERLLAYVASLNLPPGQVERAAESIQDRFAFNAAAVTREAFSANRAAWESKIRQDTGLA